MSQIRKLLPAIREKARALSANLENLIHDEAKGIVECRSKSVKTRHTTALTAFVISFRTPQ